MTTNGLYRWMRAGLPGAMKTLGLLALTFWSGTGRGGICDNVQLMRSIRIIDSACHDISGCNFDALQELEQLDADRLLEAWASPEVGALHIFFPQSVYDVTLSHDWDEVRDHLESMKYLTATAQATIYVIGQASRTGSFDKNVHLSRKRMQSVSLYLRDVLKIECREIRGGYLGARFMQLRRRDAQRLKLHPNSYRGNELTLNQAVHVFVIPCRVR